MNALEKRLFGTMPDGTAVEQYTLRGGGLECDVITYGGALRTLRVPDRNGRTPDILLGFDTLDDYRTQDKYMGALIGRFANRIGGSRFSLNGREYRLAANDGPNHLHGGRTGFDRQVWTVTAAASDSLTLSLRSPDGQENYPGELRVRVTYTLADRSLSIDYQAESDRDTICSLTNHAYFNLAGHNAGAVAGQQIQIFADSYTPTDARSIPTGEIAPVAQTPMDLRRLTPIGAHWDDAFPQLSDAGGYDHNWVLNGKPGELRPAARVVCLESGVTMDVRTTLPGIQFYSGNYLDGCPAGKGSAPYARRWGFCLETQFFPDAPNFPNFPSALLPAGAVYHHVTDFHFQNG